jgi:hypothetical protein
MKFVSKFMAVLAVMTLPGAAFAGDANSLNKIGPKHVYNSSTNSTEPGVEVTANGQSTVYQLGALGLTRSIIFDDSGDKLEAWAASALGVTVTADVSLYAPDADDNK